MEEKVYQAIFSAINEINQQLPTSKRLVPSRETLLTGPSAQLDSLGLVNLIVATEESIEDAFGQTINIADKAAMSEVESPFRSVETLAAYIMKRIEQA